jgi:NADH-quinone oxidoreductase subunit N
MSKYDLLALLPLLILGGTAVLAMLAIAVRRSHTLTSALTIAGLVAAFVSVFFVGRSTPREVTPLFVVDAFGLFYVGLLVGGALFTALLCVPYLSRKDEHREELYLLLLLATLGASALTESRHLASFFLSLETLSVALYGMIGYTRSEPRSTEAGFKYLILAAASSAFLLFGMGLLFAWSGTLELPALVQSLPPRGDPFLLVGIALLLVGVGFKLAVVPFHQWTPDVYQGAPAPVTGFVATVSKGGILAVLLRLHTFMSGQEAVMAVLVLFAVTSMFFGNLLALPQTGVKRLLAYSSIAQMGYILVAVLAPGTAGVEAATFYVVTYFIMTLGAFGVVAALSDGDGDRDALEDYRGLYWRRPWLAALMSACLFSLAGIPLTAGFVGKYYVVAAAVGSSLWWPVLLLVVNSVISIFYYLRVIVAMYATPGESEQIAVAPAATVVGSVALVGLAMLLGWLGVAPGLLSNSVQSALVGLR